MSITFHGFLITSLDAEDAKPSNWLCEENAPRTLCCPKNIDYISFSPYFYISYFIPCKHL